MTRTKRKIQNIFFAMGTVCSITVYSEEDKAAMKAAKNRVTQLHRKLNAYDPYSEVSDINSDAGIRFAAVSEDTRALIERSVFFSRFTTGMFDITTTPISQLWKDCIKARILPPEYEREKAAALTDYRDIIIDGGRVMLRRRGQRLDLGAIAKGYAADEAVRILRDHGVEQAVLNFGGSVFVIGEPQVVGIRNPFESDGSVFASVEIQDKAVVTSGLYEQGFETGGRTYHHIINPKTGYPSDSGTAGITLIGDCAEALDALSTTAFMLSTEKAVEMLKECSVEAVIVKSNGDVYITEGLQDIFNYRIKGV